MAGMVRAYSLRLRLLLTYLGLIVIGFGGLTWLAGQQLIEGAVEDFTNRLQVEALLIAGTLPELLEHYLEGEVNPREVSAMLSRYAEQLQLGVAILDGSGRVWLESGGSEVEGLKIAPENRRQTSLVLQPDGQGVLTYYALAPVLYENELLGYVRLAAPAATLQTTINQRRATLGLSFLLFVVLAVLVSLWLSAGLTKPLSRLRTTALKIAQGDLSERISEPGGDEIGVVAQAFNHMAAQVEAMVEEQRAFASNVSHELRTPLTTIRLRTEWLKENDLATETAGQYIREIDGETIRLTDLVDDLILLSRIEANRLTLGQEQIDLVRLIKTLNREFLDITREREIEIVISDQADLLPVQANMNHLRVVFRNLLENAIKYTPVGGHIVWQFALEADFLRVVIGDDGQGIPLEALPHVNKRFYRADKARSRQIEGVGLGLALVQSIINLYQGRFQIESAGPGQGTTVTVWWPVRSSAATP